jgi:hypothetical protein
VYNMGERSLWSVAYHATDGVGDGPGQLAPRCFSRVADSEYSVVGVGLDGPE